MSTDMLTRPVQQYPKGATPAKKSSPPPKKKKRKSLSR